MSVLFETSLGDIVVDLETQLCPTTCQNFLALCKTYKYNFNAFFHVEKDFVAQTGDPSDSGDGGSCIFNQLPRDSPVYSAAPTFPPEIRIPKLKHTARGTLSMAVAGEGDARGCGSQFFFTLADNIDFLDGKHAVFGHTIEGFETLDKINESFVDKNHRPMRDIRIRHVIVLDDPFPELPGLDIPPNSPVPSKEQLKSLYIGEDEDLDGEGDEEAKEKARLDRDSRAQALTLEMVGDLPFADVRPPENVLFVCKLNRVTRSEDLELIFSRFGTILSCEVIRDQKTGDSLNYAFIEFDQQEKAERAYAKMDNVLIDDRRIHVDFSQSVTSLHSQWVYGRTGGRAPPGKGRGGGRGGFQGSNGKGHSDRSERGMRVQTPDTRGYGMDFGLDDRPPPPRRRSRSPRRDDRDRRRDDDRRRDRRDDDRRDRRDDDRRRDRY